MGKKSKNRTLPKTGDIITVGVFLTLIFGFALAGLITPDKEFSEMENSTLQQKPEFSFERLKNGSFTGDIEQYMSDQIFLRDQLVALKSCVDLGLGKTYLNGVYLAEDGFYIQDYQENRAQVGTNIGCLNDFADGLDKDITVDLLLVPNASCVLSDKLPKGNKCGDQDETAWLISEMLSDRIRLTYPAKELRAEGEKSYYRTDHHWTAHGAAIGSKELRRTMKLPAIDGWGFGEGEDRSELLETTVRELPDFYGTLYSKAPTPWAKSDTIELVTYNSNDEISVRYVSQSGDHRIPEECSDTDGVPTKKGLFVKAPETTKDKYAAIMGGNFALCEIESSGIGMQSEERVLILKDSYANAMLPDLCAHFKHISMIDLRYYHMEEETVSEYVQSHGIDRVIFIYNIDFINSDNNFVWLE